MPMIVLALQLAAIAATADFVVHSVFGNIEISDGEFIRELGEAAICASAVLVAAIFWFAAGHRRFSEGLPFHVSVKSAFVLGLGAVICNIGSHSLFDLSGLHIGLLSPIGESLVFASFLTPIGLWLIWSGSLTQSGQSSNLRENRKPHVAVALAVGTTVSLLAFMSMASVYHGQQGWVRNEKMPELLNLVGRQRMLSQRATALTYQLEFGPNDEAQRVLWRLKDVVAQIRAQSERIQYLSAHQSGLWIGDSHSANVRASHAGQLRANLVDAIDEVIAEFSNGRPVDGAKVRLAADSYLTKMESYLLRLQSQASEVTARAVGTTQLLMFIQGGLLILLAVWVAGPIVRLVRLQYQEERQARLDATRALAGLKAYQSALDGHFSVLVVGKDGRISSANQHYGQLLGHLPDQLQGVKLADRLADAQSAETFAQILRTVEAGGTWSGELCHKGRDGTLSWQQTIVFPMRASAGEIDHFVLIGTDVTQTRRQSDMLKVMIENFPGGIALADKVLDIVASNKLFDELLGPVTTRSETGGVPLSAMFRALKSSIADDARGLSSFPDKVIEAMGLRQSIVEELLLETGQALELRMTPVPGGGFLFTFNDVTELRLAAQKIKSAHGKLSAFIKHAPAAVAMFDQEMRYVAVSDRWRHDFRLGERPLIGRTFYDVLPGSAAHWQAVHQRGLEGAIETRSEDVFRRGDGLEHVLRWEVRPWYTEDHAIGGIMMLTEDIAERKAIETSLWKLAKVDVLTGLANRIVFNEHLEASLAGTERSGRGFAVGIVDLDGFKEINDNFGHDAGDQLLMAVGQRFNAVLKGQTVARLGGDEFAFVIDGVSSIEEAQPQIDALFAEMMSPILIDGQPRRCAMSMGLTFCPKDARTAGEILKNADLALYRAKALGRNRVEVFSADLRAASERREQLRREVEDALHTKAFQLLYQPIVSVDKTALKGFEALLRWKHPRLGLISPGLFMDAFEDTKIAEAIGLQVMDLAFMQAAAWDRAGHSYGKISINVTSADFSHGQFVERFIARIARFGVNPRSICIEVTEGMFLGRGAQHVAEALEAVHDLGVEIALDDFGTGFASLSHIKKFPIDRLKIDQSFVRDIEHDSDDVSIVRSIIQLGQGLEISVTAEGVENEAQLALLEKLDCGTIQGYLIARPLSPEAAEEFCRSMAPERAARPRIAAAE